MTAAPATASAPGGARKGLSRRAKILIGVGIYILIGIALGVIFGSEGRNDAYKPQNEFKLDPWISIHLGSIDLSINKAVLYLFLACTLTIVTMLYIANRMQQHPNRVQTAVEAAYSLMKDNIVGS